MDVPIRAAVAQEWIASRAGSEKVFERIASLVPDANLFALTHGPQVRDRDEWTRDPDDLPRPGVLSSAPPRCLCRSCRWRGGLFDAERTSTSSSPRHMRSLGELAGASPKATHLCYVHSPMRYAWEREIDPRTRSKANALPAAVLRRLDGRTVAGVDGFAANSLETRDRIRRHYERDSEIIHPPVDTAYFGNAQRSPEDYLLAFGRFIQYKRFDLAIAVAERVGTPLVIAGSGPLEDELRLAATDARVPVRIVIRPSDADLLQLFAGARALLFPGIEDFGIVPVEAQAAGVPIIGPRLGGLRDSVDDGITGVLTDDQSVDSLAKGVEVALGEQLGGAACQQWADRFRPERFDRQLLDWIAQHT